MERLKAAMLSTGSRPLKGMKASNDNDDDDQGNHQDEEDSQGQEGSSEEQSHSDEEEGEHQDEEDSQGQEGSSEELSHSDQEEGEDDVTEEIVALCKRLQRQNELALVTLDLASDDSIGICQGEGDGRAIGNALALNRKRERERRLFTNGTARVRLEKTSNTTLTDLYLDAIRWERREGGR